MVYSRNMFSLIFYLIVNAGAFIATAYFVPGFDLDFSRGLIPFLALIAIFTIVNLLIRPIINIVLSPIILITLGLFKLVIDAGILYAVDIYSDNLTIQDTNSLIYATLLIALIQVVFGGGRKIFRK